MGVKDSKPSFISYEDAVKRVSDSELRRLREAFKRCAGVNGTALSLEAFVHEVLCDGVPYEVAEWLYQACGGTKRGIAFRELLCGIVVLTKGNLEEKIKFLWTLYANNQSDNGTYIYKREFARALHLENTSLPVTRVRKSAEILTALFGLSERVTFEQFRSWLLMHKDATVLSQWILSERTNSVQDLETPTFYQSLAGVTHLEEQDIIELEKCFWSLRNSAPTGQLDEESLTPLLSPPLPLPAVRGLMLAFDENRDGHIDFKELCCGLSAACRGPITERLKFCFKVFDLDRDGVLNKKELVDMVGILCTVANESLKNSSRASTPSDGTDSESTEKGFDPEAVLMNLSDKLVSAPKHARRPVFQLGPQGDDIILSHQPQQPSPTSSEDDLGDQENIINEDMVLPLEEFVMWSVEAGEGVVRPLASLLVEVGHVVLGLRPACRHQESDIVLGWLSRERRRGYSVGQLWYLIHADWWAIWTAYTNAPASCCRHLARNDDSRPEDSLTDNSTAESLGSLLWRGSGSGSVESGSVCSGSSGVGSTRPHRHPPPPPPINNKPLLAPNTLKVRTLTGEGGVLRRDVTLAEHRDFELVPEPLWRALALWYTATDALPRQVIRPPNSDVELELYPLQLKILRHVASPHRASVYGESGGVQCGAPERQLAYTAAFSSLATVRQVSEFLSSALGLAREDTRLWVVGSKAVLLDDDAPTLAQLRCDQGTRLLLEVRNPDLTWPEEIGALGGGSRATERRETLIAPDLPGATGLHNLGNTCFMNAALQAVWNTGPLTKYFNSGMHLYEVNTTNPLGTKGALALRYGELCKEVWSCRARSVAPLRVRWCVSRWCGALGGGGQHDAQELLAWLIDTLHEDLNQAPSTLPRSSPPAKDGDRKPDQVVATEAWEQHVSRNLSVMTELFYGQLKSKVRCDVCTHESVRFDAFNMLSLPLPMESYVRLHVRVVLLDGSVPVKYGVRVNSEGTYYDLKKKLTDLCGLSPESILLVELSGSRMGSALPDEGRISNLHSDLYAYQLPEYDHSDTDTDDSGHGWWSESGASCTSCCSAHECTPCSSAGDGACACGGCSVSVGRDPPASLCMPALFCFKRWQSEAVMSASPPGTFLTKELGNRSHTLPNNIDRRRITENANSSPTLSVKSLTTTLSPHLGKVKFGSSPSGMHCLAARHSLSVPPEPTKITYLVAVHRKQCRSEYYFVPWLRNRPVVFGIPVVVGVTEGMSGRALHAAVWSQIHRLLSKSPPASEYSNHATDCDDSLGYSFPFTLRAVRAGGAWCGAWCGACAWHRQCRGCALPTDDAPLLIGTNGGSVRPRRRSSAHGNKCSRHHHQDQEQPGVLRKLDLSLMSSWGARRGVMLAIDWDPTALHLRYQSTRERACIEHPSVAECAVEAARPVDLASCLRAFTSAERLEQRYQCSKCAASQPATKKLQIWRLPPILIIHLKRFQYVNNKWIKSQKVVNFPFQDFDPTAYLASVPQETILRHQEIKTRRKSAMIIDVGDVISENDSDSELCDDSAICDDSDKSRVRNEKRMRSSSARERLESTSLVTTPVTDDNLVDYHQHRLEKEQDPFDLKYRLYAVVSHSGQLSGGHYVAYARNPCGAWLCYNDSMCRQLPPAPQPPIDPATAYLLFYERQGLQYDAYLPDVANRQPLVTDTETLDPDESDLKKCVIA